MPDRDSWESICNVITVYCDCWFQCIPEFTIDSEDNLYVFITGYSEPIFILQYERNKEYPLTIEENNGMETFKDSYRIN
jgi:hypothetical protein